MHRNIQYYILCFIDHMFFIFVIETGTIIFTSTAAMLYLLRNGVFITHHFSQNSNRNWPHFYSTCRLIEKIRPVNYRIRHQTLETLKVVHVHVHAEYIKPASCLMKRLLKCHKKCLHVQAASSLVSAACKSQQLCFTNTSFYSGHLHQEIRYLFRVNIG